ncbi:Aminopeptidase S [Rubripirellula lacrimiformis]|uniref:Aminopeptidase S n=1 Tax=Rubripirellula lacrimiformis TaxID=1930273 RepID=A0A517N7R3_9BACT|nr:M28 family peptidase [Rubripirellula lacrimiformis]QDT03179.1 Aminopeptidase S [Rubripirellula lacrimiformis]
MVCRFVVRWMLCAVAALAAVVFVDGRAAQAESPDAAKISGNETRLLSGTRQITFEGRRAGEGYFSADGRRMVFQSERDPANPFYQIYVSDLETGDIEKVSPGWGKTTCAWIHPQGDRILFASTQDDPDAKKKQADELEIRASGRQRRYSWDYDPSYELYSKELQSSDSADGPYQRLTNAKGYDAEASYSPDGSLIVFASNRSAYERELTEREKQLFEIDPASMIDLYLMNADGSNVRRLTDVAGYDGGPFFSPDGQRICWRRFSEDGVTAEVYTMKIDGTDVQRLTEINAMSWAPYYHPSGEYLIFTTNKHGFANFELYLVRSDGQGEPVRVTDTDGFDGLPVFLPDGKRLSWTSNRTKAKQSQIFLADWNDQEARKLLGMTDDHQADRSAALESAQQSTPDFSPTDVMRHVDYLTRPELGGRLTGTPGERRATAYVAAYLESLGYEPAGENGTFYQSFDFPAGSSLGDANAMTVGDRELTLGTDWQPLSFSADGEIGNADIVFAGYGLQVPGSEEIDEYDSYVHLNVAGQWVLVFRDLPQEITAEQRQQMARFSSPRRKATIARDLGAKGIIFVAGPTSKVRSELIRFDTAASQAGVSIGVVSVTNEVAAKWLADAGENLQEIQAGLDDGSLAMGFAIEGATANATVEIQRKRGVGRNVIARLKAGDSAKSAETSSAVAPVVIVGAHVDHLGKGGSTNSLAKDDERDAIHVGADDNASGVAAMLEIAQYLAAEKKAGRLHPKRDLLIAGWSGEELGLFGSQAFVSHFFDLYPDATRIEIDPDHAAAASAHGMTTDAEPLTAAVAAYLNLDMVGRLREKLVVQGLGSSPGFASEVQRRNVPVGLELTLDKTSTRLPTDASAFVSRDVPILSAFTGAHEDYHTPRDTPDKLNYDGAAKISQLFALIARGMLSADQPPLFKLEEGEAANQDAPRVRLTAYLGTIPDYAAGKIKGLKLSGVAGEGPAAKAGAQGGDIVIELAGRTIEDIHDYTYAIEALKIGETIEMVVQRGDETVKLSVTPTARD